MNFSKLKPIQLTVSIVVVNMVCSALVISAIAFYFQAELQTRFINSARANSEMIVAMISRETVANNNKTVESLLDEFLRRKQVSHAVWSPSGKHLEPSILSPQNHDLTTEDTEFGDGLDNFFHRNLSVSFGKDGKIGLLHLDYDEAKTHNDISIVFLISFVLSLIYAVLSGVLFYVLVSRQDKYLNTLSNIATGITAGHHGKSFLIDVGQRHNRLGADLEAMRLALLTQRNEINEREIYVRTIINNMAEGVITFDHDGIIGSANDKARLMFGINLDLDLNLELSESSINVNTFLYGLDQDRQRISNFVTDNIDELLDGVTHELLALNGTQSDFPIGVAIMRVNLGYGDIYIANVRDISEDKETEKKILDARQQAERANKAKSEFLSRMSHELRTPMNAIIGFSELLQTDEEHPLNDQQSKDMNRIIVSAKHLLALINEVLDISHVESGMLELLNENIFVLDIINESVEMIRPLLERSNLNIRFPDSNVDYCIFADRMRLKQILINVMSNAAKYNRRDGAITIQCKQHAGDQLEISISDTGVGISQENLNIMFEPFTRFGTEHAAVEGTGIGLSITKKLLQAMEGSIDVRSKVGVGTTVSIKLALSDVKSTDQQRPPAPDIGLKPPGFGSPQQLFLYIDDNSVNLEIVNRILIRIGDYRLISSPSIELGVALACSHDPSIIMMNLDMAGLNAIVAYRVLRKHPKTMNTPIVAISSDTSTKQVKMAKNTGFDAYVTNPINTILLEQIIHDLRSGHQDDESRFRAINS